MTTSSNDFPHGLPTVASGNEKLPETALRLPLPSEHEELLELFSAIDLHSHTLRERGRPLLFELFLRPFLERLRERPFTQTQLRQLLYLTGGGSGVSSESGCSFLSAVSKEVSRLPHQLLEAAGGSSRGCVGLQGLASKGRLRRREGTREVFDVEVRVLTSSSSSLSSSPPTESSASGVSGRLGGGEGAAPVPSGGASSFSSSSSSSVCVRGRLGAVERQERLKALRSRLVRVVHAEHESFIKRNGHPEGIPLNEIKAWHDKFALHSMPPVPMERLPPLPPARSSCGEVTPSVRMSPPHSVSFVKTPEARPSVSSSSGETGAARKRERSVPPPRQMGAPVFTPQLKKSKLTMEGEEREDCRSVSGASTAVPPPSSAASSWSSRSSSVCLSTNAHGGPGAGERETSVSGCRGGKAGAALSLSRVERSGSAMDELRRKLKARQVASEEARMRESPPEVKEIEGALQKESELLRVFSCLLSCRGQKSSGSLEGFASEIVSKGRGGRVSRGGGGEGSAVLTVKACKERLRALTKDVATKGWIRIEISKLPAREAALRRKSEEEMVLLGALAKGCEGEAALSSRVSRLKDRLQEAKLNHEQNLQRQQLFDESPIP
uniref:CDT1 Geminin-binding domain-containing protein n=1 Tax=Chromera velia CCMP2878 TaxID=1169474 RepID=A0A0G4FR71_9ALVE|eukprot:Cvel_18342.t1-p1 / transcript=Cvel_18342.t1 / gene=Cvel_18342 / organism=Chromera_velia_CCMP2878 / gene_product=hypothetical protein / transcript_product=hypothetical protein / location=Cvel_scaffold1515:2994-9660(-) / protein_length=609 / sequence_SO=supercontig / SO=protein_coding / is_pseudo=false